MPNQVFRIGSIEDPKIAPIGAEKNSFTKRIFHHNLEQNRKLTKVCFFSLKILEIDKLRWKNILHESFETSDLGGVFVLGGQKFFFTTTNVSKQKKRERLKIFIH